MKNLKIQVFWAHRPKMVCHVGAREEPRAKKKKVMAGTRTVAVCPGQSVSSSWIVSGTEREAGHGGKEVGHTSSGPRAKTEPRFAARSFDKYVARNDSVCQPCEPETVHPDGRTRIDLGCYPSCARFSNWKGSHRTSKMSCELFSSLRQPALSTSQVVSQPLLIRTMCKNFNFPVSTRCHRIFVFDCRIIELIWFELNWFFRCLILKFLYRIQFETLEIWNYNYINLKKFKLKLNFCLNLNSYFF